MVNRFRCIITGAVFTVPVDLGGIIMRKSLSILLLFCISFFNMQLHSLAQNLETLDNTTIEWNLTPSDWAKPSVDRAKDLGIISEKTFGYIYAIDRENFCDILYSLLYTEGKVVLPQNYVIKFNDINKESILYLANIGIIKGYDDINFNPSKYITREEAATILSRVITYYNIKNPITDKIKTYDDDELIADWAKDAVYQLQMYGIMIGSDNNSFNPQGSYTVEETIVSIIRLHDYFE